MYEKITSKLRKGYKALKKTSQSVKKFTRRSNAYTFGKRHFSTSSTCVASPTNFVNNDDVIDPVRSISANKTKHIEGKASNQSLKATDEKACSSKACETDKTWETFFNNDRYKNWLRVGLALRTTCDAVAPLVDKVLIDFHLDLRDKYSHDTDIFNTSNTYRMAGHPLIKDVLKLLRRPITPSEVWRRSNVNMWLSEDGPWEIAKVFMPKGSRDAAEVLSARSFDVTGMFNLMTSCLLFKDCVSDLQQVHRLIQIRNQTMHSPRLEFSDDEVENNFKGILDLLHDEVLCEQLEEFAESQDAVPEIEKIKNQHFDIVTTVRSSFDVLEDRLAMESNEQPPHPSAMSSNRTLLRSLRDVFTSGDVIFNVDVKPVEEKLISLESLLSRQQDLAEEKMTLMFRKANYLQQNLERVQKLLNSGAGGREIEYENLINFEEETEAQNQPGCSNFILKTGKNKRKRNRKGRKKGKRNNLGKWAKNENFPAKRNSNFSLKVKNSRSSIPKLNSKLRPWSGTSLGRAKSEMAQKRSWTSSQEDVSPLLTGSSASTSSVFAPGVKQFVRWSSTSTGSSDDQTSISAASTSKDDKSSGNSPMQCKQEPEQQCKKLEDDVPGPSGYQVEPDTKTLDNEDKNIERKTESSSLVSTESLKKSVMIPFRSLLGKKQTKDGPTYKKMKSDEGKTIGGDKGSFNKKGSSRGGCGPNDGHYQQILKRVLELQKGNFGVSYRDRKEGGSFISTLRFHSKYALKSLTPRSSTELAQGEAAVEALKRFGLEVADRKNAKAVLDQFCEAAVGKRPSYHAYPAPSCLFVGTVQIHSIFAHWGHDSCESVDDLATKEPRLQEDVLLQVKSIDNVNQENEDTEQSCAKLALLEANINGSEILDCKLALNELCLRNGGTLPIYGSSAVGKGGLQRTTTVTSFIRDNFGKPDYTSDDTSSVGFDLLSDSFLSEDLVMAFSQLPSYTEDQAEEEAASALLKKMGIVVGATAASAFHEPYKHVLQENATQWGYNLPQYHTFQVKPRLDIGPTYFAVVSSRAFHKTIESFTVESEPDMKSILDARESAARKALLMLSYPTTFHSD